MGRYIDPLNIIHFIIIPNKLQLLQVKQPRGAEQLHEFLQPLMCDVTTYRAECGSACILHDILHYY